MDHQKITQEEQFSLEILQRFLCDAKKVNKIAQWNNKKLESKSPLVLYLDIQCLNRSSWRLFPIVFNTDATQTGLHNIVEVDINFSIEVV